MKRLIVGSRLDELRAQEKDLRSRREAQREKFRKAEQEYKNDLNAVVGPIKQQIEKELSGIGLSDNLHIYVYEYEENFDVTQYRSNGIQVEIQDEWVPAKEGSKYIRWGWMVRIDQFTGELIKPCGYWGGLDEITYDQLDTPDQIEYLESALEAVKILNNMDWYSLIDRSAPRYEDYASKVDRDPELTKDKIDDFYEELLTEEIRNIMTQNEAIKGRGQRIYSRRDNDVYYIVLAETKWHWRVVETKFDRKVPQGENINKLSYLIDKRKFANFINDPIETVPIPDGFLE